MCFPIRPSKSGHDIVDDMRSRLIGVVKWIKLTVLFVLLTTAIGKYFLLCCETKTKKKRLFWRLYRSTASKCRMQKGQFFISILIYTRFVSIVGTIFNFDMFPLCVCMHFVPWTVKGLRNKVENEIPHEKRSECKSGQFIVVGSWVKYRLIANVGIKITLTLERDVSNKD